ncbi:MAG: UDP-N-acetylglucosamine 1-carboxyvinyltransferase, partial [Candidatus Dadabacteria bacterium]
MEEKLYIEGGFQLNGEINAMGAKNAALPLLAATLLTPSPCILKRVPKITDVSIMLALLESLGAKTVQEENKVKLCAKKISSNADSYTLIKSLRASFLVLAPLLARLGKAKVGVPGGDIIGARPINLHLEGLSKLGADLKVRHGYVEGKVLGKRLKGAHISLSYPSVGATHQILMAASLAKGTTVLEGAAKEPEVENLVKMLTIMGAEIEVEKPGKFIIKGKEELQGANLSLIGDRIEAATYLLAGAITRGKVLVKGINP